MSTLKKVLTLNRAMIPVEFKEPRDAFRIACKGNAFFMDTNWLRFSLDEWMEDKDALRTLKDFNAGDLNTVSFEIPVPPVMVLEYFDRVHPITIHPNRENVWKRDGGRCAYCKCDLRYKDSTLDHIYPKSKGGPDVWGNLAIACHECNHKKDDELLNDIHDMELSINPLTPSPTSILYHLSPYEVENMPEFWKHFFVEFQ